MVLKEQFILFKQNEVYQELDKTIRDQIAALSAEIVNREEPNERRDQLVRGVIKGLVSVLEWEPVYYVSAEDADADEI